VNLGDHRLGMGSLRVSEAKVKVQMNYGILFNLDVSGSMKGNNWNMVIENV
jgi:hypothetical protein